jgi:glycosyltransferase involved in cell wall biosynthesis
LILTINVDGDVVEEPIALVSITIRNIRYFAWNLIKKYLPEYEMALYGSSSYRPAAGLDTYDLFLANSKFTQKWTGRYWKKNSRVIYPPVDVGQFKPGKKEKIILSVGRFFVGGHSKNQHILVDVFKNMVNSKLIDNKWSLHLVGGIADGWEHAEYVRNIRHESTGFKIYIHNSIDFSSLKDLYSKASIYWHATGFGQSEKLNPIRLEHFGIAPVEAMAAGCVPIVYHGGGLVETVTDQSGLTWKSTDDLIRRTIELISDKKLLGNMSKSAQRRSTRFSRDKFEKELILMVKQML